MTRDEWQNVLNARLCFAVNPRVIAIMEEFAIGSDMIRFPCSRENSGGDAEKDGPEAPEFWTEGPEKRLL